jgi:hypothetical protein
MLSCDSQDEVLRLALTAFPSVSTLRPLGVYLAQKHGGQPPSYLAWFGPADPIAQLHVLSGSDGRLADGEGERWTYAASMHSTGGHLGYLVVSAFDFPDPAERFFLGALAQQTAAAVAAARQRAAHPFGPPLAAVSVAGGRHLASESLRRSRASELMTDAVIRGGIEEMARAASALTRMPVAIVDQFGHLQTRAAEGAERVEWNRVSTPSFQDLSAAATAGKSIQLRQTLIAAAVDDFIQRWLGPLIGYDSQRQAGLVNTLAHFLDCGGNYDLTARSLLIHRSTLRYRLRRIRDVAGIDLRDVDTRLNLHVATRAWRVLELR